MAAAANAKNNGPEPANNENAAPSATPKATLNDVELWSDFNRTGNEMIVTKVGRRIFPVPEVTIEGLPERKFYNVFVEFRQVGATRFKYTNGQWRSGNYTFAFVNFAACIQI